MLYQQSSLLNLLYLAKPKSFSLFLANLKMQVKAAPIQLAFSIKPDMAAAGIPSQSSGVFFANVLKELLKVSSHYSLTLLYPVMAKVV